MIPLINIILLFCLNPTAYSMPEKPIQKSMAIQGDLDFLRKYNGKYPQEVKLFKNPVLKKRLQKLMGNQFNYLTEEIFQVETPIRVEGNFLYAWAMQTHSGGNPSAKLIADLGKDKLYIEILKDNKTLLYAEDSAKS